MSPEEKKPFLQTNGKRPKIKESDPKFSEGN